MPPKKIPEIAFFDKKRRVHTDKEHEKYFDSDRLYRKGRFSRMKPEEINIVLFNNKLLVKKSFTGRNKVDKFYTELICLHRLRELSGVPDIVLVDYRALTIYMSYIDGVVVSWKRVGNLTGLNTNISDKPLEDFRTLLNRIHDKGVMIYDLKGSNMLMNKKGCYLIDFADSVYFESFVSRLMLKRRIKELKKMELEIEKYRGKLQVN